MCRYLIVIVVVGLFCIGSVSGELFLSCGAENDLYKVLKENDIQCVRCENPQQAVTRAGRNDGVMVLANGYPTATTDIGQKVFDQAVKKNLRLYIEFPTQIPGIDVGNVQKPSLYSRAVVTSGFFGDSLGPMRILTINGCSLVTVEVKEAHLTFAKVAGYNSAVYGLAQTRSNPILFEHPAGNALISTTKLSSFVSGRYGPKRAWQHLWKTIIKWLDEDIAVETLEWVEAVRPMYGKDAKLPADAAKQAVILGTDWFSKGKFLVGQSWKNLPDEQRTKYSEFGPPIGEGYAVGDGRFGILEGHASRVDWDGSQQYRYCRRGDCQAESALALSMRAELDGDKRSRVIAKNLMDYLYFNSPLRQGPRNDPASSSYGMVSWGAFPASSKAYYGDDNARIFLGSIGTAANLDSDRWDKHILELILANFRTTGRYGFRGPALNEDQLQNTDWTQYWNSSTINLHPHFEAWIWTSYLWLYDKVGYDLMLTRTRGAIKRTMDAYPNWNWTNGIQQERARMILVLAWLIRVDDTQEHRAWLKQIVSDVLVHMGEDGSIREEIGKSGGQFGPPRSNAAYGTNEAPLIQENGDPSADMLYTTNFAFFGMNEAAKATGDPYYSKAADKMADFLIRIQSKSEVYQDLDGVWFRGFDMDRWEYWGSNSDHGWGVWGTLTGWTQNWIVSTLAMKEQDTSLWDITKNSNIAKHFEQCREQMMPDEKIEIARPTVVKHDAVGKSISLKNQASANYPGEKGADSLVDGAINNIKNIYHTEVQWLGFNGTNLEAVIDMGKQTKLKEIAINCMQSVAVGIFLPKDVEVYFSNDNVNFKHLATIKPEIDRRTEGPMNCVLSAKFEAKARYVKVVAKNIGAIPQWHHSRGVSAWLFVDEIFVNPQGGAKAIPVKKK